MQPELHWRANCHMHCHWLDRSGQHYKRSMPRYVSATEMTRGSTAALCMQQDHAPTSCKLPVPADRRCQQLRRAERARLGAQCGGRSGVTTSPGILGVWSPTLAPDLPTNLPGCGTPGRECGDRPWSGVVCDEGECLPDTFLKQWFWSCRQGGLRLCIRQLWLRSVALLTHMLQQNWLETLDQVQTLNIITIHFHSHTVLFYVLLLL